MAFKKAKTYVLRSGGRAYRRRASIEIDIMPQPPRRKKIEKPRGFKLVQANTVAFFGIAIHAIQDFFGDLFAKHVPASQSAKNRTTRMGKRDAQPTVDKNRYAQATKLTFEDSDESFVQKKSMTTALTQFFSREKIHEALEQAQEHNHELLFLPRTKPKNFILAIFFRVIILSMLLLMLAGFAGLGVGLGLMKAYVDTTPDLDITLIEDQAQTSMIYDMNGKLITTYAGLENREWVNYDDIPDMLKNAFIAIEDVRFYDHNGIDYKRLASAFINTLLGKDSHGGSTITQQLIKNRVLSNEQSYRRKMQEAYLSVKLESQYDKEQILEAYLNAIPLGGLNYGVKAAADDYLGKPLNELSIRECAMLGGLTQNPTKYNPRTNKYDKPERWELSVNRTNTVLKAMYNAGFINKEQLDKALVDDIQVVQKSKSKQMYDMPYFVEYALTNVITHMLRAANLPNTEANRTAASNKLRTGGYKIYTTVDPDIQNTVQDSLSTWEKYPTLRDPAKSVKVVKNKDGTIDEVVQPQAASVVLENKNGYLRGFVGGRDQPLRRNLLNRAYQSKVPVGSSLKPLSVYGPALDLGAGTGTVEYNFAIPIEGYGGDKGYPGGGLAKPNVVTLREGIRRSLNVVAARTLFDYVGVQNSVNYLVELGIDVGSINADAPGLALGTSGISPLEMAGAYATLTNGGKYLEPVAFTTVVDPDGKVILDSSKTRTTKQVYKPSTAFMLTSMLEDAVSSGTGTKAKIADMHVAGKTGTNDDYRSVYFAGYTPYYTSSLWIGHDDYSPQLKSGATGGTFAAPLWGDYMGKIHKGLENKPINTADPGTLGVVQRKICTLSGLLSTGACAPSDHKPATEYFTLENAPTQKCNMHASVDICPQSGMRSNPYCPTSDKNPKTIATIPTENVLNQVPTDVLKAAVPNAVMGFESAKYEHITYSEQTAKYFCDQHAQFSQPSNNISAEALLNLVHTFMASYGYDAPWMGDLYNITMNLQNALNDELAQDEINRLTALLDQAYRSAVAMLGGG